MRKNKSKIWAILALMLVFVLGILAGCGKSSKEAEKETVDISIVDVSSVNADVDEEDPSAVEAEEEPAEEPETEAEITKETEPEATPEVTPEAEVKAEEKPVAEAEKFYFRNKKLLKQHYEKHGIEMGFGSEKEYEAAASAVITNPKVMHKTEKEDGDEVFYIEETNEFVVLSKDGYIRTYFNPSAGIKYYNRQ